MAAEQAADPQLAGLALVRSGMVWLYYGAPERALAKLAKAQVLLGNAASPWRARALVAEARAQALLGQRQEAQRRLREAEIAFGDMPAAALGDPALGYTERQFYWTVSNAYTHLGRTAEAGQLQRQALSMYQPTEHLDPALIHLDESRCLVSQGNVDSACRHAVATITAVPSEHRGLVTHYGRSFFTELSHVCQGNRFRSSVAGVAGRPEGKRLMRYVRYRLDELDYWGVTELADHGERVMRLSHAPWHTESRPTGEWRRLAEVRLLAPVEPSKIVAVGRNYADHASELGSPTTDQPRIFFKPPTVVIGPNEPIILPPANVTNEVHYEAELAVVISRRCRTIAAGDARRVIFGYTCANDVTARDVQRRDGLPDYAKSFDTFCPLGPWIETGLDLAFTRVRCLVNGELKQNGRVGDMLTSVPALISYIAQAMTLLPGDVILTGTPAGAGRIAVGDTVAVDIDGIGQLTNPVASCGVDS